MIDIEAQVITRVRSAVIGTYPTIKVKSVDDLTEQDLPCLVIAQTDNRIREDMISSSELENGTIQTFELTAYDNTPGTARSTAKAIFGLADAEMTAMGFTRVTMLTLPTQNVTVARIFGRYQATVDKNEIIYRR